MVIGGGARLTQSWGCGASRFNSDSGLWTRRNGWLKIDPHGGKSTYILNSYAHSAYAEYKLTVCLYIYIYNKVDACRKQLTSGCGLYWRNVAPSPTLLLSTLAKFNRTGLANLFSAYRKKKHRAQPFLSWIGLSLIG
jgi:hypothetical protein